MRCFDKQLCLIPRTPQRFFSHPLPLTFRLVKTFAQYCADVLENKGSEDGVLNITVKEQKKHGDGSGCLSYAGAAWGNKAFLKTDLWARRMDSKGKFRGQHKTWPQNTALWKWSALQTHITLPPYTTQDVQLQTQRYMPQEHWQLRGLKYSSALLLLNMQPYAKGKKKWVSFLPVSSVSNRHCK